MSPFFIECNFLECKSSIVLLWVKFSHANFFANVQKSFASLGNSNACFYIDWKSLIEIFSSIIKVVSLLNWNISRIFLCGLNVHDWSFLIKDENISTSCSFFEISVLCRTVLKRNDFDLIFNFYFLNFPSSTQQRNFSCMLAYRLYYMLSFLDFSLISFDLRL